MKESIPNCCGNCDRAKKVSKKIVTEVYCNKYQQKMFVIGNCSDWIPGRHKNSTTIKAVTDAYNRISKNLPPDLLIYLNINQSSYPNKYKKTYQELTYIQDFCVESFCEELNSPYQNKGYLLALMIHKTPLQFHGNLMRKISERTRISTYDLYHYLSDFPKQTESLCNKISKEFRFLQNQCQMKEAREMQEIYTGSCLIGVNNKDCKRHHVKLKG
jgi:hypothetical protein